ncbi:heat shock 70 kDa protein 4-like isoform X2 [Gigantopelta aegis]|uniref:heat shock 70 kDa protein 4-like isoform X2 n=1 Tax=Gigantopelta aegis TaxID=1735272 RepID=UPI001B88C67F|nr:heat shock 70 kDa protein 4-like isoform X2 [Gigantopelta aegis]
MSVVGIDFGTSSCYIAVARAGGIETIANEYSDRRTPSYVSLSEKNRAVGVNAQNHAVTNFKNTVCGFKRVLGRKYSDPDVHTEQQNQFRANEIGEDKDGNVVFQLMYMGEKQAFTPVQLTTMLFTKLKHTAEAALKTKVIDVVVSVPLFFTDTERRALLDACQMAGFNCLRLLNDTTATALAYGIYKQDLPAENEKPRNVIIIDLGYSSLQVAAVAFHKGKLKVLATNSDPYLGGRDFDRIILDQCCKDFKEKYNIDPKSQPKAYIRLMTQVEKMKKQMSANTEPIPLGIECFMDDKDVSTKMSRAEFEQLSEDLLTRIEYALKEILKSTNLKSGEIHSVEVVGGSCRIPAFKRLVKDVFGLEPSTTLNSDEATARGCALQCAILSPTFRVRDFSITDCQPYSITLTWQGPIEEDSSMEVFPRFHPAPFSKMLTFYRKEPFHLTAQYTYPNEIPYPTTKIGTFFVKNVVPQANGESSKVKIKIRINSHGIFEVKSASLVEKLENEEEKQNETETMDTDEGKKNGETDEESKSSVGDEDMQTDQQSPTESSSETSDSTTPEKQEAEKKTTPKGKEPKKPKKTIRQIDLPIDECVPQLTKNELNILIEKENEMMMQDKLEKERADAKNTVEEYVYDMRDKLGGPYEKFASEAERNTFNQLLMETEDWLYGDGDDQSKQVYVDKLAQLKVQTIVMR